MDATDTSTTAPPSLAPWLKTLPVDGVTDSYLAKECSRKNAPRRDIGDRRSGLCVRIEPSGTATFFTLERQPDGSRKKYVLGRWPQTSITEARSRVARIRGMPRGEGSLTGMSPLGDLLDAFVAGPLAQRRRPKPGENAINRFIRPKLGTRPLALLTAPECAAVVEVVARGETRGKGGPKQAMAVYGLLHQALNFAVGRGILLTNVLDALDPLTLGAQGAGKVARYLSLDEVPTFWKAMTDTNLPIAKWVGPASRILILTGARPGELVRALWANVDLPARLWNIPGADRTKGGKPQPHAYPLSDLAFGAMQELQDQNRSSVYVCASPASLGRGRGRRDAQPRVRSEALAETFERLFADGGHVALKNGPCTPRDLRRTASFLAMKCGAKATMMERRHLVLGHAQPGVEAHYWSEQDLDRHREIAEAMAALVSRLVEEAGSGRVVRL